MYKFNKKKLLDLIKIQKSPLLKKISKGEKKEFINSKYYNKESIHKIKDINGMEIK